jgi:hypothetical protein
VRAGQVDLHVKRVLRVALLRVTLQIDRVQFRFFVRQQLHVDTDDLLGEHGAQRPVKGETEIVAFVDQQRGLLASTAW